MEKKVNKLLKCNAFDILNILVYKTLWNLIFTGVSYSEDKIFCHHSRNLSLWSRKIFFQSIALTLFLQKQQCNCIDFEPLTQVELFGISYLGNSFVCAYLFFQNSFFLEKPYSNLRSFEISIMNQDSNSFYLKINLVFYSLSELSKTFFCE